MTRHAAAALAVLAACLGAPAHAAAPVMVGCQPVVAGGQLTTVATLVVPGAVAVGLQCMVNTADGTVALFERNNRGPATVVGGTVPAPAGLFYMCANGWYVNAAGYRTDIWNC